MAASTPKPVIANTNMKSPPYPCTVVAFSKVPSITAFDVYVFESDAQFNHYRAMSMAAVRVTRTPADLADVPEETLLRMYLTACPETPDKQFPEGGDPRELVFGILPKLSSPYKDSAMATETGQTKAEAKALERKQARETKAAEKEAAKKAAAEKRANGVIGTIKAGLLSKAGVTQNEILDQLVEKFPDRTREGMSSTVKIQFSRLSKSIGTINNAMIEGRGRVYKAESAGTIPGKVVAPATKAEPAAETKAPAAAPAATEAPAKPAAKKRSGGK